MYVTCMGMVWVWEGSTSTPLRLDFQRSISKEQFKKLVPSAGWVSGVSVPDSFRGFWPGKNFVSLWFIGLVVLKIKQMTWLDSLLSQLFLQEGLISFDQNA